MTGNRRMPAARSPVEANASGVVRGAACLLAALPIAKPSAALDLVVDQTGGNDAADDPSWAPARQTVGSAVASAGTSSEPDAISVAAGRCLEQPVVPAATTLLGGFPAVGGPRDPVANRTIVDGGGVGSVVRSPPAALGAVSVVSP